MKTIPLTTEVFFKKAISVAEYYGFSNIESLRKKANKKGTNVLGLQKYKRHTAAFEKHILEDILKHYNKTEEMDKNKPLLFYTPSTVSPASNPSMRVSALTLNTIGTNDPLAEVILLKGAIGILEELGIKKYKIKINSIGDKDSSARFLREASARVQEKMNELPQKLANMLRTNLGATLAQLYSEKHPLSQELPTPIEFLTTPSRKYFKEILELLDNADIPFELSEKLYADPSVYSHTIFEIKEDKELSDSTEVDNATLARGGRYDQLTQPYVSIPVPSTGIVIALKTKAKKYSLKKPRKRKANACLVHIGHEARIQSIEIVETFRKRKIPIEQCLYFDRFSEQMQYAKSRKTKYIIIIGQKEAQSGVALVRDTSDNSQKTLSIDTLPELLKK